MAVREFLYVMFGVVLAFGAVVGFTDAGPVDVQIQMDDDIGLNGSTDGEEEMEPVGESTNAPGESDTAATDSTGDQRNGDEGLDLDRIEFAIHNRVNEIRQESGLSRLTITGKLREAAQIHSTNMAEGDFLSHRGPNGGDFSDRYDRVGYECRVDTGTGNEYATGAENVAYTWAYGEIDVDYGGDVSHNGNETSIGYGIVEGWMHSEGHRENILRDYWNYEGIGVATTEVDGNIKVYATQNFC